MITYRYTNAELSAIISDDRSGSVTTIPSGNPLFALLVDGDSFEGIEPVEIADFVAPPTPIPDVTPRQARLALNAANLRDAVEAYVAGQDRDTRDTWEFASVIRRQDPLIL